MMATSSRRSAVLLFASTLLSLVSYSHGRDIRYTYGTDARGVTRQLAVDRYPALYTGDFGDCLGGQSLFNVTKFDAAYYTDNLTIAFHFDGRSNIKNDSLMMHISLDAYGKSRFDLTFDPCKFNITSLCPLNANQPITGWAAIPVSAQQMGDIPSMAFTIPDVEGSARLQIFSNSSRTEIGCFQAVMRNGATLSHPEAVAPTLAVFTLVAIVASFVTAAYGVSVAHMRMHHAHSLSVLVVLDTFQYVFFSGAMSVNWPSILVGWWGNFAWSAGQIYSPSLVRALGPFAGVNGNASQVGGAGSTVINNGGGLITSIYGRSLASGALNTLARRATYNESDPYDYTWAGNPVTPGMPTPGTWNGLAGSLSAVYIPAADSFLVSLIWFLVALGIVALCMTLFKYSLEALVRFKWTRKSMLAYFREHWLVYLKLAVLRTSYMAFFTIMTLAMYQFSIRGSTGATAIAAVVFVILLLGTVYFVFRAIRARTRLGKFSVVKDQIVLHRTKLFKVLPMIIPIRASTLSERNVDMDAVGAVATFGFFRICHTNDHPSYPSVHQDEEYVKKYGWLAARYRRTRWWFFAYYTGYQFVRACFLGGGTRTPLAQVYGLLIFEVIAFVAVLQLDPWEGSRNTALAVYILSISKILTCGLSIGFLPTLNLDRVTATVLGILIIVIQGLLVVAVMILSVLSGISSWMSLTRNQEDFEPDWLDAIRIKYFTTMEKKAPDTWQTPKPKEDRKGKGKATDGDDEAQSYDIPRPPSFSANSTRQFPKFEDEEKDSVSDLDLVHNPSVMFDANLIHGPARGKRTSTVSSRHSNSSLRRGHGRTHRASWSSKDFAQEPLREEEHEDQTEGKAGSSHPQPPSTASAGVSSRGILKNGTLDPSLDVPESSTSSHSPEHPSPRSLTSEEGGDQSSDKALTSTEQTLPNSPNQGLQKRTAGETGAPPPPPPPAEVR